MTGLYLLLIGLCITPAHSTAKKQEKKGGLRSFSLMPVKVDWRLLLTRRGDEPLETKITSSHEEVVLKAGSLLVLKCRIIGKIKREDGVISWLKNRKKIRNSRRFRIRTRTKGGRLRLKEIIQGDSGRYRCCFRVDGRTTCSKTLKVVVRDSSEKEESFFSKLDPYTGYCESYTGDLCSAHVGTRRLVFIRAGEFQRENRQILTDNIHAIKQAVAPGCYETIFRLVCLHLFPPCQNYNHTLSPLRLCREHCQSLKTNPCQRGLRMISDIQMIKKIISQDCNVLPMIDSPTNERCAQVDVPDAVGLREEACRRQHRTGERLFVNANVIQPARDVSSVCNSVVSNSNVTSILNGILPHSSRQRRAGRFLLSASGVYCFRVRIRFRELVDDATKYQNLVSLPKLPKPSLASFIPGFFLEVERNRSKKITFPVGFLSNYILDENIVIPNVTLFYSADKSGIKLFGEGLYDLCGTEFKVRIEQTSPDVTFLTGQSHQPVDFNTLEIAFGFRQLSSELVSLLGRFQVRNKQIKKPTITIIWDNNGDRVIRFSGETSYPTWGPSDVTMEIIFGPDKRHWLSGISANNLDFKSIFSRLSGSLYNRLTNLLSHGMELKELGMIFATLDASNPVQQPLQFQSGILNRMAKESPMVYYFFEATVKVKRSCRQSTKGQSLCQLLQYAVGAGTEGSLKVKKFWDRWYLELSFKPNKSMDPFHASLAKTAKLVWNLLNPLTKLRKGNVEVLEDTTQDFASRLPVSRYFWLYRVQINVQDSLFHSFYYDSQPVDIKAYFFQNSKKYKYIIKNISLYDCSTIINEIWDVARESNLH